MVMGIRHRKSQREDEGEYHSTEDKGADREMNDEEERGEESRKSALKEESLNFP
jgi:hypothetical protein